VEYICKLLKRVAVFLRRKKVAIAVDSSSFRTHTSSTWYEDKKREQKERVPEASFVLGY
jgi:hypothetical protein